MFSGRRIALERLTYRYGEGPPSTPGSRCSRGGKSGKRAAGDSCRIPGGYRLNDEAILASRGVKQLTYGGSHIVLRLPMGYVTTGGVRPWHRYFPHGSILKRIFRRRSAGSRT